ncbi:sporulation transcription factor Spo0A [Eubacteriales bacterium OttesenSCG-928-M02]|nr:sporulation transcription factor Spo0A [Eubacteriales bacterium OttesenSCG-928-M02]
MMEKRRVLVVEDNVELCDGIAAYFREKEEVELIAHVYDGLAALAHIAQADVVVLDLIMPHLDGFALLDRISELGEKRPEVVVISALGNEEVVYRACNMGAKYYMVKPFNMESLYKRTMELAGLKGSREKSGTVIQVSGNKSLDEKITNIFLSVGIPAHIKGYHYLRYGVKLVVEDSTLMSRITKALYPSIADHFDTTPSKVERAIRHAIDVAWSRGKIENINRIFGFNIYSKNDKPTNGEFIALVADKLTMERTA